MRHIRACPVPAAVPRACAMPGRAGPCRRVRRPAGQGACRMRRWRPRTAYRPTRLALQLAPLAPISQYSSARVARRERGGRGQQDVARCRWALRAQRRRGAHLRGGGLHDRRRGPCPSPAGSEARAYAELLRRGEIGGGVAEARRRAGRRTPRRARREWVHSCCCSALLKEAAVCGMERRSVAVGRLC